MDLAIYSTSGLRQHAGYTGSKLWCSVKVLGLYSRRLYSIATLISLSEYYESWEVMEKGWAQGGSIASVSHFHRFSGYQICLVVFFSPNFHQVFSPGRALPRPLVIQYSVGVFFQVMQTYPISSLTSGAFPSDNQHACSQLSSFWLIDRGTGHPWQCLELDRLQRKWGRSIASLTYLFGQTAVTRAVGLLFVVKKLLIRCLSIKSSGLNGSGETKEAHPTRMPQAARRDCYGCSANKKKRMPSLPSAIHWSDYQ